MIEQRSLMNERAFLRAHEFVQVKSPVIAFDDCLSRMQLCQLAANVVRDVVVRLVESILYEVLYAHNCSLRQPRLTKY